MIFKPVIILLATAILWPINSFGAQNEAPQTWNREEAQLVSVSVSTETQQARLRQLFKAGDSSGTLDQIREIEQQQDWPVPVRERVIFEFVSELRHEPPRSVSSEVIDHLRGYQSKVLVPHEDHPRARVPMFNIRAATSGVVNHWARQEAAFEGATHLASGGDTLVRAYLQESSHPRRRGMHDALSTASPAQLKAVTQSGLEASQSSPDIVTLAADAALLNHDLESLESLLETGHGNGMVKLLRKSAETFDSEQNSRLLNAAMHNPSRETAALAIAQLAPSLSGHGPTEDMLLQQLGDPELGSSAALALARNPGESTMQKLESLAGGSGDSLAVARAQLALQVYASQFEADLQQ